ncbi:hypothetical protein [Streptomyces sp. NPDC050145]|uniref:hypothetical protein n=1 Tax=Streptomyces sp. NPDC050145 TaxID=3365602 RepID=UPI00378A0BE1
MGEKPENSEDGQGEVKEKKRLDLSVPQVAGSAVAAVVAAKLASSFGVYGTILGAGVVSALATCGGTVFQHFFKRTGEQIRDATVQTEPKGRQIPVTAEGRPVPRTFRSDASMDATQVMASPKAVATGVPQPAAGVLPTTTTWGRPSGTDDDAWPADEDGTQLLDTGAVADLLPDDPESDPERTRLLGTADPERTRLLRQSPVDEATRLLRTASAEPELEPEREGRFEGSADEFTEGTVHRSRVKSWKRPLIAAALVFGVTMGGITTYELVSGHSFNGDSGSTTFRDAFTGHGTSSGGDAPAPGTSTRPSDGSSTGTEDRTRQQDGGAAQDGTATPTPSGSTGKGSGTDPDAGAGTGTGSGDDSGTDPGAGSGDGDSSTSPTPTPTPSQSAGSGTGDDGSATGAAEGAAGADGQPAAQ